MAKSLEAHAFRKTGIVYILLVAAILAGLYLYTLATFLAAPPSEGFSREVAVGKVDYGFISNMQTPVVTVPDRDGTLTVVAMDGHVTTFMTLASNGKVLDRFSIDLDLYKASQLDAYRSGPDTLVLYYVENDLFEAIVNMKSQSYVMTMAEPEVRSFVCDENLLVLEQPNGLFWFDASLGTPPVPLIQGAIQDYAATIEDGVCYVLASVNNDSALDFRAIIADRGLSRIKDILIIGKTRDNYLKTIQDVFVQDQIMTGLYVWTDNKYGLNHLTIQQLDLRDGEIRGSFSNSFPIHKGRFVIDEVADGRVSVLMQDHVHRGVNLVRATMEEGREPEVVPLTKTRELSQLSDYFDTGEEKSLVFWDSVRTTRAVKFASTEPALVKSTTSILTVNYLSLAGITLFVILAAAFIGTIPYLMFTSLVPLVIVLAMTRFTAEYRNKAKVQNAVAGAVGTGLKLFLTWNLIHGLGQFAFRPALIGGEPVIYLALVATSVVSWLISSILIQNSRKYESVALNSFVVYLLADYAQYIMMVLVYVGSAMILDKI
jgi:hypothetical protein